jgi:hypothetical protein
MGANLLGPAASFKMSDILNIGGIFGSSTSDKGAPYASAVNNIVDGAGAGAMSYFAADKTGNNKLQKKAKTADAVWDGASAAAQAIPVVGTALSLAMQGFQLGMKNLAPKMKSLEVNKSIGGSSSFGGLANAVGNQGADINAYNSAGVGKFTMNKSKMADTTADLRRQQTMGTGVLRDSAKIAGATGNTTNYLNQRNKIDFAGGFPSVAVGKKGMDTSFLKEFNAHRALKFKAGGPIIMIAPPENVIVEGKLHSQLNHMADVVDVPITKKGVPVTAVEREGGVIEQAAELERDEVILHLELTNKLEDLAEEDTEEAMIEAGKILVKEILKNTRDSKSKLLKTVQ